MRHLFVALLGLALAGCISPNQGRPLNFGEFPSAEYQALAVHGNGRIDGRAFLKTRAGTLKPAAGKDVALIPATRYMAPLYKAYQERRPLGEPDARAKIYTRTVRADAFTVTVDRSFKAVIAGCAEPQAQRDDTWINPRIRDLYVGLYEGGHCHSVEVWDGDDLVGGLYGVSLGAIVVDVSN